MHDGILAFGPFFCFGWKPLKLDNVDDLRSRIFHRIETIRNTSGILNRVRASIRRRTDGWFFHALERNEM